MIRAANRSYNFCPVSIPAEEWSGPQVFNLKPPDGAGSIPAQIATEPDGSQRLWWICDHLSRGEEKTLLPGAGDTPAIEPVTLKETSDGVDVIINGKHFTTYNFAAGDARPYFYPLYGPYRAHMTRHYPMREVPGESTDHRHHRSLYIAHGDVNGVDNWSEGEGHGRTVHQDCQEVLSGPVFGRLVTSNTWVGRGGDTVLTESRTFRFYNLPADQALIDASITFAATEGDVTFGDTKEGGLLSVRVATSMDASGRGRITNAYGGTDESETWGRRAHWCDYSGPVATERGDILAGITVFDTPGNFRYPTYWHVRNYGLMTANPFGISHFEGDPEADGSMLLKDGDSTTFAYRVLIHAGGAREGQAGKKYLEYLNPPQVDSVS